ncbi:MAG: GtrA family protein [Rubrivivax sp.]|nr:GtrA family protein [Rubrivivax sp.]
MPRLVIDRSLLRFAAVGMLATLTHVAVAAWVLWTLGWSSAAANGLAFVMANLVSYMGNTHWSFSARPDAGNAMRFAAVSLAALALTMGLAAAVQRAGGSHAWGIALVVTVVPGLSYLAHRHLTYRHSARDRTPGDQSR